MKQGNYEGLKGAIDYYINRQVENGLWPARPAMPFGRAIKNPIKKYEDMREYRYNDVNRMSTTIAEQKNKAKYIVQTFAQIVDFLNTKKKKNIKAFSKHKIMRVFSQVFERTKDASVLYKMGFDERLRQKLLNGKSNLKDIRAFRRLYSNFEMAKSKKGLYEVEDGITWDAIFCVRDIMRELPKFYLSGNRMMEPEYFERSVISHKRVRNKKTKKILSTMLGIVKDHREGI
jgi:hypothetical protein